VSEQRELPSNLRSLKQRIVNIVAARGRPLRRIQRVVANTAVGQMLPAGVVKGGTAMKLRVGEAGSRFTPDVDAARSATVSLDDYLDELASPFLTNQAASLKLSALRALLDDGIQRSDADVKRRVRRHDLGDPAGVTERARRNLAGHGPLGPLLADPDV